SAACDRDGLGLAVVPGHRRGPGSGAAGSRRQGVRDGPFGPEYPISGRNFPMTGIIEIGTIEPAVLVLGAGGAVGRGVLQAAVEAGRPVIAVSHDETALSALRLQFPDAALRTLEASVASDGDAAELAERLRALGISLAGVVACIAGEHPCGRLTEQPADVLRRTLDQDLMPHLFAARHLFPLLPQDGRHGYVLIGGPGANYPWAGYGHCSIAASALRMMARVLHDEAGRHGLRVQLLSLDAPVGTDT